MIFLSEGVHCCLESVAGPPAAVSELLTSVISAKNICKPAKFQTLFATKIIQQRSIVSSHLAGRFSIVLVAGSWRDPQMYAWGIVRLFFMSGGRPVRQMGISTPSIIKEKTPCQHSSARNANITPKTRNDSAGNAGPDLPSPGKRSFAVPAEPR